MEAPCGVMHPAPRKYQEDTSGVNLSKRLGAESPPIRTTWAIMTFAEALPSHVLM